MSKIKEVLCMHHTHLDVGYTHVQPAVLQLHMDYIDQAIDLCEQTEHWPEDSKFRWTCETTLPVIQWLEVAGPGRIEQFQHFLKNGQIGIAAQFFHGTPLSNSEQIARMLYPVKQLRERFGIELGVSLNHDINGQPWPMSQILLDAGIKMQVMGINTHFGGYPLSRPYVFRWQAPDGRDILAFNGEIYVLFNWMLHPEKNDLDYMKQELARYLEKLEENGYPYDFVFLTATNPPASDNNPPDPELANLVRRWNEREKELTIRFATPEMLLERVERIPREQLPVHAGDWTDYWNFGSASAARETQLSRKTKRGLATADLLESLQGSPSPQYKQAAKNAWLNLNLYDEHTWGHAFDIEQPDRPDVAEAIHHKAHWAYQAAGLTTYLLGRQMELLAANPEQSGPPEGVLLLNPTPVTQIHALQIPRDFLRAGRHLAAQRLENYTISKDRADQAAACISFGHVAIPPFSWQRIPLSALKEEQAAGQASGQPSGQSSGQARISETSLENQYYLLKFDPLTGRIVELWDKLRNWQMIDRSSAWTFFQYVQETIDVLQNPDSRKTFYNNGNWNTSWQGCYKGASRLLDCRTEQDDRGVALVLQWAAPGVKQLEQRITLYQDRPEIGLDAFFDKEDIRTPEGIYFAFPLNLQEWQCHFDTAGMFVELDAEQLPGASRDWVTVDRTVSVYDGDAGITLACPDAPLVQVGGFQFGRKSSQIQRQANPLLLAWPMNNYWETNFRASQPGLHHLYYEISTFARFEPVRAFQAGLLADRATELAAAVCCPTMSEGRLLDFAGGEIVPLYLKGAEDGRGLILRARNLGRAADTLICGIPGRTIRQAILVDTLEQDIRELPLVDQKVSLAMEPGALCQIRIIS